MESHENNVIKFILKVSLNSGIKRAILILILTYLLTLFLVIGFSFDLVFG